MKVNRAVKRAVITVIIVAGGLLLCNFLYLMLDQVMNGFVREWFDRNYIYHEWEAVADGQDSYAVTNIRWSKLKEFVFRAFLVGLLF